MKTSKAQRKAVDKYKAKNPSKQKIYNYRSNARAFIRNYANSEDLDDLTQLIEDKRQELKEGESNETKDNSK